MVDMSAAPLRRIQGGSMKPHRYRIIVCGRLGEIGRVAFEDFQIEPYGTDTALTAELDLPGLRAALDRIMGFGLELVELSRLADEPDGGRTARLRRRIRRR